jgi:hypothetical protein
MSIFQMARDTIRASLKLREFSLKLIYSVYFGGLCVIKKIKTGKQLMIKLKLVDFYLFFPSACINIKIVSP